MSKTNQSIVLNPSETAQVLELQALLNKDGMSRSISLRSLTMHLGSLWLTLKHHLMQTSETTELSLVIPLKELFKQYRKD